MAWLHDMRKHRVNMIHVNFEVQNHWLLFDQPEVWSKGNNKAVHKLCNTTRRGSVFFTIKVNV